MPRTPVLGEFEQLVLLALVRLGADAYGATVSIEIEQQTGRPVSISAVHTTLDRLEEKGFVRSRLGEPTPQRGGSASAITSSSLSGCARCSRRSAPSSG